MDELLKALRADMAWVERLPPRARIKALKRIEKNARKLRRMTALSYADTMGAPVADATDPGLGDWLSSRLVTTQFRRPT